MENTNLEVKMPKLKMWEVEIIIAVIVATLIFAYVLISFSNTVKIAKSSYERNLALAAFSSVDANLNGTFREIDCTGSEKYGVTCKTITGEVIKFISSKPMPDFRLHVARDGDNLDIKVATGIPSPSSIYSEDISTVFKLPDFRP